MMLEPGKKQVKTDETGYYIFENLNEGTYKLYVEAPDGSVMYVKDVSVRVGINSNVSVLTLALAEDDEAETDKDDNDSDSEAEFIGDNREYGIVRGYLYDVDASLIKNAKVYLGDIAEQVTDKNGMFEFKDVPPGKYSIYTKTSDGTICILKTVEVEAGKGAVYKLQIPAEEESNLWLILILVGVGVLLIVAGGITAFLIIRKKKLKK